MNWWAIAYLVAVLWLLLDYKVMLKAISKNNALRHEELQKSLKSIDFQIQELRKQFSMECIRREAADIE